MKELLFKLAEDKFDLVPITDRQEPKDGEKRYVGWDKRRNAEW